MPLWISTKTAAGTAIPIKVIVGSQSFSDSLPAGNFDRVFQTTHWEGDTYTHEAEIALSRNNAATTAYIPLFINITWPRQTGDYINYYVKQTTFKINTERTGDPTPSPSASTPATVTKTNQTATIVAGIMGAIALFALVVIGFLLVKLRRRRREWGAVDTTSERPVSEAIRSPSNVTPFITQPPTGAQSPNNQSVSQHGGPPPGTPAFIHHSGTEPFHSSDLLTTLSSPHDSVSQYPTSSVGLPYLIPPPAPTTVRTGYTKGSDLPPYSQ